MNRGFGRPINPNEQTIKRTNKWRYIHISFCAWVDLRCDTTIMIFNWKLSTPVTRNIPLTISLNSIHKRANSFKFCSTKTTYFIFVWKNTIHVCLSIFLSLSPSLSAFLFIFIHRWCLRFLLTAFLAYLLCYFTIILKLRQWKLLNSFGRFYLEKIHLLCELRVSRTRAHINWIYWSLRKY